MLKNWGISWVNAHENRFLFRSFVLSLQGAGSDGFTKKDRISQ